MADIESWKSQISKNTSMFREAFGKLDAQKLNLKPDSKTWSIAQVIDHLIKTTDSYLPVFDQLNKGTYTVPFTGRFAFLRNFFAKLIKGSVEPERKRKVKTFPVWEPTQSNVPGDILEQFEKNQQKLSELITANRRLIEAGTPISSPANKHIVYPLNDAIDIIVMHQVRHFNQAKEILQRIG